MSGGTVGIGDTRVAHARTTCHAMVDDTRVVFDVLSRSLLALRPDVSAIWPLLDGSATVDQLSRELADATRRPVDEARMMVHGWIGPLLEAGLLEFVPELPE